MIISDILIKLEANSHSTQQNKEVCMKALHFVLTNILKDIKKHFIQDVPDDLYGCLSCKKAHCSKITWEFCEDRIRHITNTSVAQANDKYTLEAETTYHYFEESKKNI